ncbi:hypothetical protein TraAM80_02969 [Trypanosoma rangeli]|uniref:Uncharacterized protein n=1 Tax=Trypanosoma rangeli TaxID=5698 RepID=A0A422NRE5_TRYRA|nr:uncharacterized protein TraAM80_02969 [Trypanosoma rangeli]RNF08035.1 hypothetical protein TraAM80_02969 [Trypanosoma rangeli]|eukprot:RNF08035.1 hypothetical protein TraAM80_02969 [Trypanosoma rangeli]
MDEELCTAALLALDPADVAGDAEHAVAVRHITYRRLSAFPKIVEKRLLALLLSGQLHGHQLTVMDTILQHVVQVSTGRLLSCSPALMRSTAIWPLLRISFVKRNEWLTPAAPLHVFSDLMLPLSALVSTDNDQRSSKNRNDDEYGA